MKSHKLSLLSAAVLAAIPLSLTAQVTTESTKTTTTTSTGAVTTLAPDVITVRSETSTAPLRYSYSKTTQFVDSAGAPVSVEIVKSGVPVVVHYVKQGDQMIAQKVIVQRVDAAPAPGAVTETKKTTTTTTAPAPQVTTQTKTTTTTGTVSGLDGQIVSIRTEAAATPVRYSFTKTTQYVDEAGNPVSIDVVKSGAPVTIHYVTEGDQQVAQKVVVQKTTVVR